MFLIDKALTRLPWGLLSQFVQTIPESATKLRQDQKPQYIKYVYDHVVSPFAIVSAGVLQDTLPELKKTNEGQSVIDLKSKSQLGNKSHEFGFRCDPVFINHRETQ